MKLRFVPLLSVVLIALTALSIADDNHACQATAQASLHSCLLKARSDLSVRLAICDNLADQGNRRACEEKGRRTRKDADRLCSDQNTERHSACRGLGSAPYDPVIDPANFVSTIDNPYMPLKPGTTFVYQAKTKDGVLENNVIVTPKTRKIMGVTCVEVHDSVKLNGKLTEDTLDWYAQDKDSNVWYFGENSKELSGGLVVTLEGSWTGGVDGAKPGIIMEAHPAIGDLYRQEFLPTVAEDLAGVLSLDKKVEVPAGTFDHCLETKEITPLEPGALEHKFYAQGVGMVYDVDLVTGEKLKLIEIKH